MSPRRLTEAVVRDAPVLGIDQPVGEAAKAVAEAGLPALPVVDHAGRLHGIFGEREFIRALFPGYLGELHSAAFVPGSVEDVIEKRIECRREPVSKHANTEAIAAAGDYSDAQVAETFLHHRVLIVPLIGADDRVVGIVSRSDFFRALVERLPET